MAISWDALYLQKRYLLKVLEERNQWTQVHELVHILWAGAGTQSHFKMDHELELLDKIISSCSSSCYPPSISKEATIFTRKLAFEEGISLGVVLPLLIKQHMQPNVVNMPEIFWLISNLVTSTLLLKQIIICHEREWERELKSLFCQISWSDLGTQSFFSLWTGAGTKSLFSWTSNTLTRPLMDWSVLTNKH